MVLLLLFGSAMAFNMLYGPTVQSSTNGDSISMGHNHLGEVLLFMGVTLMAWGVVLQQRFLQREALDIPVAAKFFYQHIFQLFVLVMKVALNSEARLRILHEGFFAGWDGWTWSATIVTWLTSLAFSFVVAKFSAMASAVISTVSVILTCTGDILLFGRPIALLQVF